MKTNKKTEKNYIAILALAILVFFLANAQDGCVQTSASKTGLDFSLVSGVDKLSSGKTISQGDTFNIQVHIENYDKEVRSGEICVGDDQDKAYGGIESQCRPFSIKAAEVIQKASSSGMFRGAEKVQAAQTDVFFPSSGEFSYHGMFVTQSAKAFVYLKYAQSLQVSAPEGIKVPIPETETVRLSQDPAPITVSADKSISKKENSYKIALDIGLSKNGDSVLSTPDFKPENENYIVFSASMPPQTLSCEPSGTYDKTKFEQGLVELKNTKFIKCSALVDIVQQQQWPLLIGLSYGVKISKDFAFTIKVEK